MKMNEILTDNKKTEKVNLKSICLFLINQIMNKYLKKLLTKIIKFSGATAFYCL